MKILLIADLESKFYYDFYKPSLLEDVDLILSAGDLHPDYLQFLVTMAHCPLLYVHGNHDSKYEHNPPLGCECIEDKVYVYEGIRILGLGGSIRYNSDSNQYTEREMRRRVKSLRRRIKSLGGIDIFLSHSPALGLNDSDDRAHRGFDCFYTILDKYSPKYFVHGHIQKNYGKDYKAIDYYKDTTVINAYEYQIIEI